jgi:hypothetical protein
VTISFPRRTLLSGVSYFVVSLEFVNCQEGDSQVGKLLASCRHGSEFLCRACVYKPTDDYGSVKLHLVLTLGSLRDMKGSGEEQLHPETSEVFGWCGGGGS